MRVLLVDDSGDFLEAAARFLATEPDLTVLPPAASGPEAVEKVEALRPDVVLMDVAMRGMNGLEATRLIKARPDPPRVIVLTTYDSVEHRMAAEEAGADAFVGKSEFVADVGSVIRAMRSAEPATAPRAGPATA